jgi:hypothetical protein
MRGLQKIGSTKFTNEKIVKCVVQKPRHPNPVAGYFTATVFTFINSLMP